MDLDLNEALRTTGAARRFHPDPVPDETLEKLLDTARFAPSGGNRQAWRVVVVRDPEKKRILRDLYRDGWYQYVAMRQAGLTPWAPVTDRAAEAKASSRAPDVAAAAAAKPGFPELLDQAPVLLVLLADLRRLAAIDRDLDRYGFVGGASIYPFAWSLLLSARTEGLGGVLTTVAVRHEDEVRALLEVPEEFAVAGIIALGRPVHQPARLTRLPVSSFTTVDSFKGRPLTGI
jgi:nitroreductase